MKFLTLCLFAIMVVSCMSMTDKVEAEDMKIDTSKLSERELKEFEDMKKRLETDPEFRREVEAQLEEKISELPASEQKVTKKRLWGLLGLRLLNPFLFPFIGKRSADELTTRDMEAAHEMTDLTQKVDFEKKSTVVDVELDDAEKSKLAKRFWGLWGLGYGLGFGYPWGLGLWGKKRNMDSSIEKVEDMPTPVDRELMEKREAEFRRFEEAEKRLAPEIYKREGEMVTVEEVKEMKKRWWGLGYGYGLGLGYGWGLGYPWGFWGKREDMPTEKRDQFVSEEMMKANREAAYERLLRDL